MLNNWVDVTLLMRGSFGYVVQEPDFTDYCRQFLWLMYWANWEKRIMKQSVVFMEDLYAFNTGHCKLPSHLKRAWLWQFDSWSPSVLRAQLIGLLQSERLLEVEWALGSRGVGVTCVSSSSAFLPVLLQMEWHFKKFNSTATISKDLIIKIKFHEKLRYSRDWSHNIR